MTVEGLKMVTSAMCQSKSMGAVSSGPYLRQILTNKRVFEMRNVELTPYLLRLADASNNLCDGKGHGRRGSPNG